MPSAVDSGTATAGIRNGSVNGFGRPLVGMRLSSTDVA